MLKEMFKKTKYIALEAETSEIEQDTKNVESPGGSVDNSPAIPDGAWIKCTNCQTILFHEDVIANKQCCPNCDYHFSLSAWERLNMVVDKDSFIEWDKEVIDCNVLHFPDYEKKLKANKNKTGLNEAVVTGIARIRGLRSVICVMDNQFLMGSMGQVLGEKITRAVEKATNKRLPIIIFTTSGGARMQEGIVSLMQMAKVSGALKKHSNAGLLYVTVLTHPTTGGVTASFAMLGDIILAEPGALIGFAGPRVIEQTIKQKLPDGFQRSEFLVEKGFVDRIVPRKKMRSALSRILRLHYKGTGTSDNKETLDTVTLFSEQDNGSIEKKSESNKEYSAWDCVIKAREADRPIATDYISRCFTHFIELHGDRLYGDDPAIVGGIALFNNIPVTVIGQQKGRNTKENIYRNFGMPNPEGYRKALRLMQQAQKFNRPIICLVDTPGAFCGIGAEERGQGEAIAKNLSEMMDLKVPILTVIIGEGGSGGALAMAVANEVWMLENSIYSILSPEGFASILWKDAKRAKEASEIMKITAQELYHLGVIESVINEPEEGIASDFEQVIQDIKVKLSRFLMTYKLMEGEELSEHRFQKYRKLYTDNW